MNTVEASILLEEAIDLAAALPDDAVYARLLAFRDGWFRSHRIAEPAFEANRRSVINEFDATVHSSPVFKAAPTATVRAQ